MRRDCATLIPYYKNNLDIMIHLERRSKTATRLPDFWGMWGGGIEKGETSKQALLRETQEEMSFVPTGCRYVGPYQVGESVKYVYILLVDENFNSRIKLTEAQAGKFFSENEIKDEKELINSDKKILFDVIERIKNNKF